MKRIYIKHRYAVDYIDITKYAEMPIVMSQTVDGTFSSINLVLNTPKKVLTLDTSKVIPPKYIIKVSEVEQVIDEIEHVNTFYFLTSDGNTAKRRKEVLDENDNILINSIYTHEIEANSLISILDNKGLPNYTITQPKNQYFSTYVRSVGMEFAIAQRFQQDGTSVKLIKGTEKELGSSNNDNNALSFGYDSNKGHYVEFTEINETTLTTTFELEIAKSAPAKSEFKQLGFIPVKLDIKTMTGEIPITQTHNTSDFNITLNVERYDLNNNIVDNQISIETIQYNGSNVTSKGYPLFITSLSVALPHETIININASESLSKVRVYISLGNIRKERNSIDDGLPLNTQIQGFDDNQFVKTYIERLVIKASTGAYNRELDEKKTTLLEFVEKGIFDYNFNSRHRVKLADDVKPLLDVVAKESEWGDYTLREFLERAFKYVGIVPILNSDYSITYSKVTNVSRFIDLDTVNDKEGEQISDDYFDKVTSTAKNLVSQEDFVTEILPLTSTDTEFSQITDLTGGFLTSNDIYFVSTGIIYAPNLSIDFTTETINTNMGKPFHWDITRRFFEQDIYDSFPNIRMDYDPANTGITPPRSYFGVLTRGNTISYKSGSNVISGIFNIAEDVQGYNFQLFNGDFLDNLWGNLGFATLNPQYAIIELIIMLAFEVLQDPLTATEPKPDVELKDIANYELQITYCPIFTEVTTKYVSNMKNRKALNWEKKLNLKDRTISYQNNEEVLRKEMEKKGNVKILYSDVNRSIAETIPVNSIVNDNLYVTSKKLIIHNKFVEVEYVLQENFILQNEDIRLNVEFERYAVPYEYVEREIMIENHMIFSQTELYQYFGESFAVDQAFILRTLLGKGIREIDKIDGALYSKQFIDSNPYLMRVAKLESKFTMMLNGKFTDNYSAGSQRYEGANPNLLYNEPLRYTNGNGKFNIFNNFEIGFNNNAEVLRLQREEFLDYDVKMFPAGTYKGYKAHLNVKLINMQETLALNKDARERISFTHTSYLETNNESDIKFYSFKPITNIGLIQDPNIYLNDDLTLERINYVKFTSNFSLSLTETTPNSFIVRITSQDANLFSNGIVLYNVDNNTQQLVGVIKNPVVTGDYIEFYIYTTRYGLYEDENAKPIVVESASYEMNVDVIASFINGGSQGNYLGGEIEASVFQLSTDGLSYYVDTVVSGILANSTKSGNYLGGEIMTNSNYSYKEVIEASFSALVGINGGLVNGGSQGNYLIGQNKLLPTIRQIRRITTTYSALAIIGGQLVNGSSSKFFGGRIENSVIYNENATYNTRMPSVGNLTCRVENGQNRVFASVTNNDSGSVRVLSNGQTVDTLSAGQTKNVRLGIIIATGLIFNYSVSAQGDYKLESAKNTGSQLITYCSTM